MRKAGGDGARYLHRSSAVRVLIVEDSDSQRARLVQLLQADGRFVIVGAVSSAFDARVAIRTRAPDVVTLDIDLPSMDGIEFLRRLMRLRPMPVVMLSGAGGPESSLAATAKALGAVDWLEKTPVSFAPGPAGLAERLFAAAKAEVGGEAFTSAKTTDAALKRRWNGRIVLIGASTGGVQALEQVLPAIGPEGPPVLISQHMPEKYLGKLATRLSGRGGMKVALATHGARPSKGNAYLAPGGSSHLGLGFSAGCRISLELAQNLPGPCPSVAHLFTSALPMAPKILAILLSGMGKDGAEAMLSLRRAGARCLVQDAASSVVFGMPGAALRLGAAEGAVPLAQLAERILALTTEAMTG